MTYEPQEWNNGDSGTPLSAERLMHMESGIEDAHDVTASDISDAGSTGRAILRASNGSAVRDEINLNSGNVPLSGSIAGTGGASDVQAALEDLASRVTVLESGGD